MGKELLAVRFETIETAAQKRLDKSAYKLHVPYPSAAARSSAQIKRYGAAQQAFARQTIILKEEPD